MLFDIGIDPIKREAIRITKRGYPKDLTEELMVWLAMPGFSHVYHAHVFEKSRKTIASWRPSFDDYRQQCLDNWGSATNEDVVKIAMLRPKWCAIPLIVQMAALDDLKNHTHRYVAEKYKVSQEWVENLSERHRPKWLSSSHPKWRNVILPPEFSFAA